MKKNVKTSLYRRFQEKRVKNKTQGSCPKEEKNCEECKVLHCPEETTRDEVTVYKTKHVKWINVLHFYQPLFLEEKKVQKITEECYLPITRLLLERPDAKAVININGCLLDVLNKLPPTGKEFINNINILYSLGQIDITGTGKHHPILPLIPENEVLRQVMLQEESLRFYFHTDIGEIPKILFPPELAFVPEHLQLFKERGYKWILIDEISLVEKLLMGKYQLRDKESDIKLLVRDRKISESLGNSMQNNNGGFKTSDQFVKKALKKAGNEYFIVTVTNAESFGFFNRDRWKLLAEIYDNPSVCSLLVRDVSKNHKTAEVETIPASWMTSERHISKRIYYPLWFHPQNRLHLLLWQLLDISLEKIRMNGSDNQNKIMDYLLNSDTFLYSSCMPWWNGAVVEKFSDSLVKLLENTEMKSENSLWTAQSIRKDIYNEVSTLNKIIGKQKGLVSNVSNANL